MEESRLRGKGLYCFFVGFKKAFDMVPHKHHWRCMEELGMPREHKLVSASMYEKVICCVHMGDEIFRFL